MWVAAPVSEAHIVAYEDEVDEAFMKEFEAILSQYAAASNENTPEETFDGDSHPWRVEASEESSEGTQERQVADAEQPISSYEFQEESLELPTNAEQDTLVGESEREPFQSPQESLPMDQEPMHMFYSQNPSEETPLNPEEALEGMLSVSDDIESENVEELVSKAQRGFVTTVRVDGETWNGPIHLSEAGMQERPFNGPAPLNEPSLGSQMPTESHSEPSFGTLLEEDDALPLIDDEEPPREPTIVRWHEEVDVGLKHLRAHEYVDAIEQFSAILEQNAEIQSQQNRSQVQRVRGDKDAVVLAVALHSVTRNWET